MIRPVVILGGEPRLQEVLAAYFESGGRAVRCGEAAASAAAALDALAPVPPELVILLQTPGPKDSIATATADSLGQHLSSGPQAGVFAMQALAQMAKQAAAGPLKAQVIMVLSQPRPRHRDEKASQSLASATLLHLVELAAETLAPELRVNAILLDEKQTGSADDLCEMLDYVATSPALTGQILNVPSPYPGLA